MENRNTRKHLTGEVIGVSGSKTIKVKYDYKVPHAKYHKEVKRRTVLHVHDESGQCKVGDRVEIMETRPLSKLKRWCVVKVIAVAQVAA